MAAGAYALLLAVRTAAAFGSGHLFTHCAWSLDSRSPLRSDHRSVLGKPSRDTLGCVRVALPNRIRRSACGWRLARRRRADRSRSCDGPRSDDPISTARVAAETQPCSAFLLTAPHILARPHILALPVMVAWIATLIRAVDTRAAPPWRALPLMLCANLHGSFTFGLAIGMCSVTTALQVCKTFQTSCSYSTNTAYR